MSIEIDLQQESLAATEPRHVYVVDDDPGLRTSLSFLLRSYGVGVRPFAAPDDLLDEIDRLAPGILLVDIRMPGLSGIDLIRALRQRDIQWPIVAMTGHAEIPVAVQAIKLGAIEFLEKPFTDSQLEEVMRAGFRQLKTAVAQTEQRRTARKFAALLSPRQRQVFDAVCEGMTSKEIAQQFGISHRTVEQHRLAMMARLNARSMAELVEIRQTLQELESEG